MAKAGARSLRPRFNLFYFSYFIQFYFRGKGTRPESLLAFYLFFFLISFSCRAHVACPENSATIPIPAGLIWPLWRALPTIRLSLFGENEVPIPFDLLIRKKHTGQTYWTLSDCVKKLNGPCCKSINHCNDESVEPTSSTEAIFDIIGTFGTVQP